MGKTERDTFEVSEFIAFHNALHKNYCEIVVLANGYIEYAIPSHIAKLEMLWGIAEEDLFSREGTRAKLLQTMPISASPIHWLCEDTNIAVCWYNNIILPYDYTETQLNTIKELIVNGCIDKYSDLEIAVEKTYEDNRGNIDYITELYDERREVETKLRELLNL